MLRWPICFVRKNTDRHAQQKLKVFENNLDKEMEFEFVFLKVLPKPELMKK